MEETKYCVYAHIDDNNVTFYVGIGDSKRPHDYRQRSKFWHHYTKRYCASGKPKIEIIHEGVSWEEACGHEQFWILFWGRRDLGNGVLVNMTAGGDGIVGAIRSEETRKKVADALRGKKHSEEHRRKNREAQWGKKRGEFSEEHKRRLSEASRGKKHPEERRRKNSEAQRGKRLSEETRKKVGDAQRGKGKGYSFHKKAQKFRAYIEIEGKHHHLGLFLTEAEASNAYQTALSSLISQRSLNMRSPQDSH